MSKIEWTDITSNPIHLIDGEGKNAGHICGKISAGCLHCYAEEINNSGFFSFASQLPYTGELPDDGRTLILDEKEMIGWASKRKPHKIFVCSMTDWGWERVPEDWRQKMLKAFWGAPKQTFQLLSKRPETIYQSVEKWCEGNRREALPDNIWVGTTIENQQACETRMEWLKKTRARWRFLSCEPLLSPVELGDLAGIHWVIVGGESGAKARPCEQEWMEAIVSECRRQQVHVFVKQMGSNFVGSESWKVTGKGGDFLSFPKSLQYRQLP